MNSQIAVPVFLLIMCLAAGTAISEHFSADKERPNVIIIDIDRVNQERMPCYGYERNTTPNICRFGEENVMFKQPISQAGWTASSVASVFTGQYPGTHGIESQGDRLDDRFLTMADAFRESGYRTAAFPAYAEEAPDYITRDYNLDQGFQRYNEGAYRLIETYSRFSSWQQDADEPYFAFIQGYDPHVYSELDPSRGGHYSSERPPEVFQQVPENSSTTVTDIVVRNSSYYLKVDETGRLIPIENESLRYVDNQYDDILKSTDRSFGAVIEDLKRKEIYSDSIIVVMANHGEMLNSRTYSGEDRVYGHGQVYDDDIKTFMMIHFPDDVDKEFDQQVEFIDLFPTLVDESGIDLEGRRSELQGESMTGLYRNGFIPKSYKGGYAVSIGHRGTSTAVRNETWKYVENTGSANSLYSLKNDPDEDNNLLEEREKVAEQMKNYLEQQRLRNRQLRSEIIG